MDAAELLAPIPRPLQDVLCLGLNYTEHAEEAFGYTIVNGYNGRPVCRGSTSVVTPDCVKKMMQTARLSVCI